MITGNYIYLPIKYDERFSAKRIAGARWEPQYKMWGWPIYMAERVCLMFPRFRDRVRRELGEIEERKKTIRDTSARKRAEADIPPDYNFKLQPFEHQLKAIRYCLAERRFALLMEMGTGKTKVIIDTACILKLQGLVDKVLIISPMTIIDNWIEEIEKNSSEHGFYLKKHLTHQSFFHIINYEKLINTRVTAELIKNQYDMVVLDESSRIKNHQAKRTKAIIKTFRDVKYKYIMSGTPVTQGPIDIYSQYEFLNPAYLGFKNYYAFRGYHCEMGGYGNYQITGYRDIETLKRKIAAHSIQLKKEDCLDLPEKIYERRILEMTPEIMTQYKCMKDELYAEIGNDEALTASIVLTKIIRLQQITSGAYVEKNPKLDELVEIIQEDTSRQVIVWCRFIPSIKVIEKKMQELNIQYSVLHGEIDDRQGQINRFQAGETRVFIGQIQTGGVGVNITAGNIVVYFENTFSLEDRLQSEARAHRYGQRRNVTYIDIVYKGTIDMIVYEAIKNKQDLAKTLVSCFKGAKL